MRTVDAMAVVRRSAGSRRAIRVRRSIGAAVALLASIGYCAAATGSTDDAFEPGDAKGGAAYAVPHWTVDGGGGRSSGGAYTLTGTIAQPDSDPLQPSTGGPYAITGGFWSGIDQPAPTAMLFADGFEAVTGNGVVNAAAAMPEHR